MPEHTPYSLAQSLSEREAGIGCDLYDAISRDIGAMPFPIKLAVAGKDDKHRIMLRLEWLSGAYERDLRLVPAYGEGSPYYKYLLSKVGIVRLLKMGLEMIWSGQPKEKSKTAEEARSGE